MMSFSCYYAIINTSLQQYNSIVALLSVYILNDYKEILSFQNLLHKHTGREAITVSYNKSVISVYCGSQRCWSQLVSQWLFVVFFLCSSVVAFKTTYELFCILKGQLPIIHAAQLSNDKGSIIGLQGIGIESRFTCVTGLTEGTQKHRLCLYTIYCRDYSVL